jgi:hypothetical protein
MARETEQVPTVVHELVDCVSLDQGRGALLCSDEVHGHESKKSDEDDPRQQFACGKRHCRVWMRDDVRHGRLLCEEVSIMIGNCDAIFRVCAMPGSSGSVAIARFRKIDRHAVRNFRRP